VVEGFVQKLCFFRRALVFQLTWHCPASADANKIYLIVSFLIFPTPSLIVNVTTTVSPIIPPFKEKLTCQRNICG